MENQKEFVLFFVQISKIPKKLYKWMKACLEIRKYGFIWRRKKRTKWEKDPDRKIEKISITIGTVRTVEGETEIDLIHMTINIKRGEVNTGDHYWFWIQYIKHRNIYIGNISIIHLTMFFSKKSALLLLPILCLVTNGQEYDPCLMYTSYGDCSMCILGKIPFGKQCLDAIPHCL